MNILIFPRHARLPPAVFPDRVDHANPFVNFGPESADKNELAKPGFIPSCVARAPRCEAVRAHIRLSKTGLKTGLISKTKPVRHSA
jgi:hypothetical protein